MIVYFFNKKIVCFWWFWQVELLRSRKEENCDNLLFEYWKNSGSDGFDFWRGELLCTSSWNRFACSVAASSQLWAYFDLITGNLPLRPWSRLVRGWKYKQLVVKAAMAASLSPPPENISLHKVGLQQGHRLKLYPFDFQHQRFFHEEEKQWQWRRDQKTRFAVVWKLWLF